MKKLNALLPSIWVKRYEGYLDWKRDCESGQLSLFYTLTDEMDDRLIWSRHNSTHNAYCAVCNKIQPMTINWRFGGINELGSVNFAWTEMASCNFCGLNSRMRGLYACIMESGVSDSDRIYIAEQTTNAYLCYKKQFPRIIGSEYLGNFLIPGEERFDSKLNCIVRHEDLTNLSFDDGSFDVIITQDVFEHIPDFNAAFRECNRILAPGGRMFFTVPFSPSNGSINILAMINSDGSINHLCPPEYHLNPINDEGSLCFQHFGWGILDSLHKAGFDSHYANFYWGPWQGHFGYSFVFCAKK